LIQSEDGSQADATACSFDPVSKLRVLAVCDDWSGKATHGGLDQRNVRRQPEGDRQLTRVFECGKLGSVRQVSVGISV
jgi:hypothetical protein